MLKHFSHHPMFWRALGLAVIIILLDQLTKRIFVEMVIAHGQPIEITPFFNLVLVWNRGVSFGMLAGHDAWLALVLFTCAMTCFLLIWCWRTREKWVNIALGLAIGGAIGNLIDRFRHGAVADFLDFHLYEMHWPAFNVADSAIVIGVCIIALTSLRCAPKTGKEPHDEPA